jgi:hypothetical protein
MITHAFNPSTLHKGQGALHGEFQTSQGYIVRCSLKKKRRKFMAIIGFFI